MRVLGKKYKYIGPDEKVRKLTE